MRRYFCRERATLSRYPLSVKARGEKAVALEVTTLFTHPGQATLFWFDHQKIHQWVKMAVSREGEVERQIPVPRKTKNLKKTISNFGRPKAGFSGKKLIPRPLGVRFFSEENKSRRRSVATRSPNRDSSRSSFK
ncbi:hypothetical protein TGVAND_313305 [Toxoplasma gondii VAND]|uniref:Uncharacterized protein n=1 Tax=Toxoplasma gondii VAND TaxID=933077 RepID=A0A086QB27_TOXGO|nr:hypothetical protein TGVAND_313305 [Toxoplasma gondii VAND]